MKSLTRIPGYLFVSLALAISVGCGDDSSGSSTGATSPGSAAVAASGLGSSTIPAATTGTTAATPTTTADCEDAAYPSLQWTQCELANLASSTQNATAHADLTAGLIAATAAYQQTRLATLLADSERQPNPNPCTTIAACPIDPRLQSWANGSGIVAPVIYTSRSGATMSGHVWATKSGPAKRPGIVIINGSIIGFEQIYAYAAQALAKAGFVVMTFDSQGEGMSDQFGETPDQLEDAFSGDPVLGLLGPQQGPGGNGLPFYDGGTDALNFFLSTPGTTYSPVPSRTSNTSHAAKQTRRVASGLNNAYNPFWQMLDSSRIGIAGHSYGAVAASWLAQEDPRVTTAVAWDELCLPVSPAPDEFTAFATAPVNKLVGLIQAPALYGFSSQCFGAPAGPAPAVTKPAMGLTSDYLLVPAPYLAPPETDNKGVASLTYSQKGLDTASIVIAGGTHYEYNDVPAALPATLHGIDMVTWYTTAWFSKYLKQDPKADAMLMTTRWRNDSQTSPTGTASSVNLYSWHYRSRLAIHLANGQAYNCEDLHKGCTGQTAKANDNGITNYSFVAVDTTPDGQ